MTSAALALGWGLIIAFAPFGGWSEIAVRQAFRSEQKCLTARDLLLEQPRYQGALILVDCQRIWAPTDDFGEKHEEMS